MGLCVCIYGHEREKNKVIIQDSHCVSGLMRWRLIARSKQRHFGTGWPTVQREDGSHRRGERNEYQIQALNDNALLMQ